MHNQKSQKSKIACWTQETTAVNMLIDDTSNPNGNGNGNSGPSIIDLRGMTTSIENNHICKDSRKGYIRQLTTFMSFLFNHDTYHSLLTNIVPLQQAKQQDEDEYNRALVSRRRTQKGPKLKDTHFCNSCQR